MCALLQTLNKTDAGKDGVETSPKLLGLKLARDLVAKMKPVLAKIHADIPQSRSWWEVSIHFH